MVRVVLLHATDPPGPVQEAVYVVVTEGATETEPAVAPPVEKFPPVQDVAF
jgi:hypothetical protein